MSTDVDAPIRLSEEAQDAAVAVPKAAMRSQLISGICGLLVRFQRDFNERTRLYSDDSLLGCRSICTFRAQCQRSTESPNWLLTALRSPIVCPEWRYNMRSSGMHYSGGSK